MHVRLDLYVHQKTVALALRSMAHSYLKGGTVKSEGGGVTLARANPAGIPDLYSSLL